MMLYREEEEEEKEKEDKENKEEKEEEKEEEEEEERRKRQSLTVFYRKLLGMQKPTLDMILEGALMRSGPLFQKLVVRRKEGSRSVISSTPVLN